MRKESISASLWQEYINVYFYCEKRNFKAVSGGIISVWNCNGKIRLGIRNKCLQQQRIAMLVTGNWRFTELFGGNSDFSYREHSVWLACSHHAALRIAKQFQQAAFYYVKNGRVWLVNTNQPMQRVQLKKLPKHLSQASQLPSQNNALLALKRAK